MGMKLATSRQARRRRRRIYPRLGNRATVEEALPGIHDERTPVSLPG